MIQKLKSALSLFKRGVAEGVSLLKRGVRLAFWGTKKLFILVNAVLLLGMLLGAYGYFYGNLAASERLYTITLVDPSLGFTMKLYGYDLQPQKDGSVCFRNVDGRRGCFKVPFYQAIDVNE